MTCGGIVSLVLSVASAIFGILAAGFWFAAATVKVTFDFRMEAMSNEAAEAINHAMNRSARLNRVAAFFTAVSALLMAATIAANLVRDF